jgi:pyridoxamine 5'-phosphate oxidase
MPLALQRMRNGCVRVFIRRAIPFGCPIHCPSEQTVPMDEASVDPEPMTQLSRWLEVARTAGEPMPEAMAVATATTAGRPSSRMVLLRGIGHRGLIFYTDRESDKGRELRANPVAAALFHWFLPMHRQVRVSGKVEVVDDDQSDAYWRSRPPGARRSAVASHQSEVVVSRALLEERVANLAEAFPDETGPPRPPRWGGYLIRPEVVELWEEGADRLHDRLRYQERAGTWMIDRLSP